MQSAPTISTQTTNHLTVRNAVHQRAMLASEQYRVSEAELLTALEDVEKHKVHLHFGHSSLFQYAVRELKLSENVAYSLITVMRKSKEVPELKQQIRSGTITLGHAKRISSVLTNENSNEWFEKASTLTQRQLEKEVVKVRPLSAVQERASYVTESRIKLEVGLSESQMLQLRKVQDLVCQATAKHVSIEDTLVAMTEFYLKHRDPITKAKRITVKKGSAVNTNSQVKNEFTVINEGAVKKDSEVKEESAIGKNSTTQNVAAENTKQSENIYIVSNDGKIGLVTSLETSSNHEREPIPAQVLHAVNLRDQRRCTYQNRMGRACNQTRWLEYHHLKPVSQGGKNILENLVTLCSGHHRLMHSKL